MAKVVTQAQLDALCAALDFDRGHADRVSALGEELFARTRHLHGLTKTARPLIRLVATLHSHDGAAGPHAPPLARPDGTLRRAFPRLSPTERGVAMRALERVAGGDGASEATARFHAPHFEPGGDEGRQLAQRVAAIVRIAEALDQSRTQDTDIVAVVDDGEGVDLLVAGGPAAGNAVAAMAGAELWNQLMPRPIRSVRVHEGRAPRAGLIEPACSVAEAARRILLQQLEQFMARAYGLCYGHDIEYVHELRVALRRARSAMRVFHEALNGEREALQAEMRWFASELGAVRDLDVFLGFLTGYRADAPRGHKPFLRRLVASIRGRRRRHYRTLLDVFQAERYQQFIDRVHPMLQAPVGAKGSLFAGTEAGDVAACEQAPRLLRDQLKKVARYDRRLHLLTPEAQHRLRIECKRLRYAAEFLADIYPGRLIGVIEPTTRLQDDLGEVHDADVYRERIVEYCWHRAKTGIGAGDRDALHALLGHLRRQRECHLKRAASTWKAFTRRDAVERLVEVIKSPRTR
ncbi:MAG: CHAD domain-containing protein [Candidatus Brocadiae bacterium]|nr:CHAD domain-containing protein [Candidatus Brocadiia bacterium]